MISLAVELDRQRLREGYLYAFARFFPRPVAVLPPRAFPAGFFARAGGVLEISADASSWFDLGPYITAGGYNGTVETAAQSPIAGRKAWVGSSDGDLIAGRVDPCLALAQPDECRLDGDGANRTGSEHAA